MTITKLETPCREWTGTRLPKGYGQFRRNGRNWYLHRWVMAQVHGEEAIRGKVVMHRCDNPPCYRFDHLRIGTAADNGRDMADKGRFNMGKRKRAEHGSLAMYRTQGCRCERCVDAARAYKRAQWEKNRERINEGQRRRYHERKNSTLLENA